MLAAAGWRCSVEEAATRLLSAGAPLTREDVDERALRRYRQAAVAPLELFRRLWAEAAAMPWWREPAAVELLTQLRLVTASGPRERPSQFFGVVAIDQLMTGLCELPGMTLKRSLLGRPRQFAVLTPLCDLPGRIRGFWLHGPQRRGAADVVFCDSPYGRQRRTTLSLAAGTHIPHDECGVAFLEPALERADVNFGDAVCVMPDVLLALRLHVRHERRSRYALPLVASFETAQRRTYDSLARLGTRRFVYWHPTNRLQAAMHAVRGRGSVSQQRPLKNAVAYGGLEAGKQLQLAMRDTCPASVALTHELAKLPTADAEGALLQLAVGDDALHDLLADAPALLQQKLAPFITRRQRQVVFQGGWLIARDDGWYFNHQLVCNAKLRIEQQLRCALTGERYYAGTVTFRGDDLPFCAPALRMETRASGWLREFLDKQDCHGVVCRQPVATQLVAAALALQPPLPPTVLVNSRTGWCPVSRTFRLPQFSLGADGFGPAGVALPKMPPRPGDALPQPLPLSREAAAALQPQFLGSAAAWRLLAAVAAAVVAPALQRKAPRFALAAADASALQGLLALGAHELHVAASKSCRDRCRAAVAEMHKHHWPQLVVVGYGGSAVSRQIAADFPGGNFLLVAEPTRRALALDGTWCSWPPADNLPMPTALASALFSYLHNLCRRHFATETLTGSLFSVIARDMARWFVHAHAAGDPLAHARILACFKRAVGYAPDAITQEFGRTLATLLQRNQLTTGRADFTTRRVVADVIYLGDRKVFVDQTRFAATVGRTAGFCPDCSRLNRVLEKRVGALAMYQFCGRFGWLLDEQWLQPFLAAAPLRLYSGA